jgi:hypothetical protein
MSINIPGESPHQNIDGLTERGGDPNHGPFDRTQNILSDEGDSGTTAINQTLPGGPAISAVFDNQNEAEGAVSKLRDAGVSDASLSLVAQSGRTLRTANADGDVVDEEHTSILRGILGGGALGAGLGVAALAIPGVGPLVAVGAIAASAVPGALAIGAAAGAAAGMFNEALKSHGVSDEDAAYYHEPMKAGGVLVAVTPDSNIGAEGIREILHANGGHNAGRGKTL